MKKVSISLFLMLLVTISSWAQVCKPCQAILPMQEMMYKSELVVVARRSDKHQDNAYVQGPDLIELEILEVLKSNDEAEVGDTIDAQSWYGICPYGVQMDRYETALVFLNKASSGFWIFSNPTYEAATYSHAACNDEAMTLKGKDLIIWDPAIRQEVPYPLTEFKRVFVK